MNSTLSRELRGLTQKLPRVYIPELPLHKWPLSEIHRYHWIILNSFVPHHDLLQPLKGKGDPIFEIIRHIQMNPYNQKIQNAIPGHPLPVLEFSENIDIALYFSSYKDSADGALFCLNKYLIPTFYSCHHALDQMIQEKDLTPCLVDPLVQLNDLDDPKPKRQKAVYVFQRDLRHPIDYHIPVEKIIVRNKLQFEIRAYLKDRGIIEEFVYAKEQLTTHSSFELNQAEKS
ncbi:MAG: hypothetical protein LLG04_10820 [Parachlamydia sp.]|nr:hypothetical protein [Parachlamydia sp.]